MQRSVVLSSMLLLTLLLGACSITSNPLAPPIAQQASAAPSVPAQRPATAAAPLIITFGADERDRLVYEPLIEAFNRDNADLWVQYVPLDASARLGSSQPAIVQRSMRAIASGADVFALDFPRAEHMSSPLLRDLAPLIDADPQFDRDDFYPLALPKTSGMFRLVPLRIEVPLLAYNKELWAQQHLPAPRADWTWHELLGAAEQLAQQRDGAIETYGLLNDWDGHSAVVALLGELHAANISLSGSGSRLNQPAVSRALERTARLVQNGTLAMPLVTNQRPAEDTEPLLRAGQAAMWPIDRLPTNLADLPYATGVAAYPAGPLPAPRTIHGIAISSGTQHPNEAWRWVSWLSRRNVDAPSGTQLGDYIVPARKSVVQSSGAWQQLDAEAEAALQSTLMRPVAADGRPDQALVAALTEALVAVLDGQAAGVALQTAQGTLDLALAELAKPPPSPAPVIVATPEPTPAVPVARIRFESGFIPLMQLSEVVQQFNREHDHIEVIVSNPSPNAGNDLEQLAQRADCFTRWPPGTSEGAGSVRDLQPLVDADATFAGDDYLPGVFDTLKRDGKLIALPFGLRLTVIGYNKTLFDAAGHEYPHAAWTWDDFARAAERLTQENGDKRVYGFGDPVGGLLAAEFAVNQQRAALFVGDNENPTPNFADPVVLAALQAYVDLLRTTSPHQRMDGFDLQQFRKAGDLRNQGRLAMWFDLDQPRRWIGQDPGITVAMAPPPFGMSRPAPSDIFVMGFYVSNTSPYPEACWTFYNFLSTNVLALVESFWPARISVGDGPGYQAAASPDVVAVWQAYREALDRAPGSEERAAWMYDVDSTGRYWLFRALDRALQGKALDRELTDAQFWTEQYLACTSGGEEGEACAKQVDPSYTGFAWQ